MTDLPATLVATLRGAARSPGLVTVLTGAGISAESGIPTFRGEEGYWRVGSRNYRPEELATRAAFERMPDDVWAWFLFRRGVCGRASPNEAHRALVRLEAEFGDRFRLVTQNVDGLHLRAGSTRARTYCIHGDISFLRCRDECSPELEPVPAAIPLDWPRERAVGEAERALLRCGRCGGPARPHVLWFDECYDEPLFKLESTLRAAGDTDLLLVVGTSGATTLPARAAGLVHGLGKPIVVVNLDPNPFSELAVSGGDLRGTAVAFVPAIVDELVAKRGTAP